MASAYVSFSGPDGHGDAVVLHPPEGPCLANALLIGGPGTGLDEAARSRLVRRLAAMGLKVACVDPAAPEPGAGCPRAALERTIAALAAQAITPDMLIGHGTGALAALSLARSLPGLQALALLSLPHAPDLAASGMPALPTLLVQPTGTVDGTITGLDPALAIMTAAGPLTELATLSGEPADLGSARAVEAVAAILTRFAGRRLELSPPAPPPGAPEGIVRVAEAGNGAFLQDVVLGPWLHLSADEPPAYGGSNRGLSPYGLLAAALGACTSMTIRMYAQRKGWPLAHVTVDVSHDKVHAQDSPPEVGGQIDTLRRLIHLEGHLGPAERARLLAIADNCPVYRTLSATSRITTALAED